MNGHVVALGETMGLVTPRGSGRLRHCLDARLGIGGAESNVAIGVARLGHRATWIGRVGDDPVGTLVLDELRAEGVDVSQVLVDDRRPTGMMLKHRGLGDATSVTYARQGSAGSALGPDDVCADVIAEADFLHVTGITPALSASAAAAVRHAVRTASESDCRTSFDLNYRSRLWDANEAAPVLRELVAEADVVFAGEDEAALVVGVTGLEQTARAIAELGPEVVIIKRGPAGAVAVVDGVYDGVDALEVARVVDPVGAGDAFAAGYLAGRLDGLSPPDALALAARAGAFAVTGAGDWESAPDRSLLSVGSGRADLVDR